MHALKVSNLEIEQGSGSHSDNNIMQLIEFQSLEGEQETMSYI